MNKRTKIVATIGPASDKKEILKKMVKAGMNVVRINFSHGTYESNGKVVDIVHKLSEELGVPIGVMADLQGPRIRTVVEVDAEIKKGEVVVIYDISKKYQISSIKYKAIGLDSPGIIADIEVGNEILIEDGLKRLKIIKKEKEYLEAKVINGGIIKNHKGINIPDAKLRIPAVTEKDEKDLEYAMTKEVDFVALSFVSNGRELGETREKIKKMLGRDDHLPQLVSKVERKEAIKNIDEIISASDVVMVARGDLGIEMEESKVVIFQKEIISKCLQKAKPVIVATQMLNSMIENPLPTRAEVADVSNAVCDHTDAVMLSGESANGKYPVESIETMAKIAYDTEKSRFDNYVPAHIDINDHIESDYAGIIASAWKMAQVSGAKAILTVSSTGFTAQLISNYRPEKDIFVATDNLKTYNQLSIVWGVTPYLFDKGEKIEDYIELMVKRAKKENKLKKGDKAVVIMGRIPGGEKMRLVGIREIK